MLKLWTISFTRISISVHLRKSNSFQFNKKNHFASFRIRCSETSIFKYQNASRLKRMEKSQRKWYLFSIKEHLKTNPKIHIWWKTFCNVWNDSIAQQLLIEVHQNRFDGSYLCKDYSRVNFPLFSSFTSYILLFRFRKNRRILSNSTYNGEEAHSLKAQWNKWDFFAFTFGL